MALNNQSTAKLSLVHSEYYVYRKELKLPIIFTHIRKTDGYWIILLIS